MTVKCLPEFSQRVIVEAFVNKYKTIDELVTMYGKSRRTIIRVLEDANIDPGIKRRVHAPKESKLLPPHVDVPLNLTLPTVPKLNWFQRAIDKVVRGFAFGS